MPRASEPSDGIAAAVEIFQRLDVAREGILYVQSSVDWLRRVGIGGLDVLRAFNKYARHSTVVMPSYPTLLTHREYVASRPTYDVRRTPAQVGLIAELFRRLPGVERSLEPDYPVAAHGPAARLVTNGTPQADPFGAESPYRRMLSAGGTLVGLGVSLNTNSFIHAFDSALESEYPFPVYEPGTTALDVITATSEVVRVPRRVLREEFQRDTQPSTIAAAMVGTAAFKGFRINDVQFFRWDLSGLERWAMTHARERLANGALPCWLERLPRSA